MPEVLEHSDGDRSGVPRPRRRDPATVETAERRARDDLRRQIARLERALGELFASAFPRRGFEWQVGAAGGPRVLAIGDLERVRDALALRLRDARAELARQADVEEAQPRAARVDDRRARSSIAGLVISRRGHRRAGLPALPLAPALGHPRDALRLVAGPALLGLPVSRGAAAPGRRGHSSELMAKKTAQAPRPRRAAGPGRGRRTTERGAPKPAPQPRKPIEEERPAGAVGLVPAGRDRRPGRRS